MSFFLKLLPLWVFVILFKTSGVLHYSLLGVLGLHVLPLWAVGIATGSTTFLQLLLDIPAGKLIDRYGARFTLRLAVFFFLIGVLVLLPGLSPLTYGLTLLFSSLGWLFFTPSLSAYLLSTTPAAVMGRVTSSRRIVEAIGGILGTIGIATIVTFPVSTIALILLYPFVGAQIIVWLVWKPERTAKHAWHHARAKVVKSSFGTLREVIQNAAPAAPALIAWTSLESYIWGTFWFVIPLGLATSILQIPGYTLSFLEGAALIAGFFIGTLVDKTKKIPRLVFWVLVLFTSALLSLSSATGGYFLFFSALLSAGSEIVTTALWAWLDRLDKRHDQDGLLSGAVTLAEDIGWTVGPVTAGILFAAFGPSLTILSTIIPSIFLLLYIRKMIK